MYRFKGIWLKISHRRKWMKTSFLFPMLYIEWYLWCQGILNFTLSDPIWNQWNRVIWNIMIIQLNNLVGKNFSLYETLSLGTTQLLLQTRHQWAFTYQIDMHSITNNCRYELEFIIFHLETSPCWLLSCKTVFLHIYFQCQCMIFWSGYSSTDNSLIFLIRKKNTSERKMLKESNKNTSLLLELYEKPCK